MRPDDGDAEGDYVKLGYFTKKGHDGSCSTYCTECETPVVETVGSPTGRALFGSNEHPGTGTGISTVPRPAIPKLKR